MASKDTTSYVIPPDVAQMVEKLAAADRVSQSAAVRLAIAHEYERRFGDNSGQQRAVAAVPASA